MFYGGIYLGSDLSAWTAYTSGNDITITDGSKFAIACIDGNGLAVSAGIFVADSKA